MMAGPCFKFDLYFVKNTPALIAESYSVKCLRNPGPIFNG